MAVKAALAIAFVLAGGLPWPFASAEEAVPLQPLIDRTAAGETLVLESGRTYAGPAVVARAIAIRSDGEAIVENGGALPAITLEADGVVLKDLRIRDLQKDPKQPAVLVRSDRNRIEGMRIETRAGGIYLRNADDNEIRNNRIEGPSAGGRKIAYSKRGNGIDLLASARNVIEGNELVRVHDGVYLESSNETLVKNNFAADSRYGYHVMFSGKPQLLDNAGERNVTGGMVMSVEGAIVRGNRFVKQSENVNSQGILLYDVHRSEISRNRVEGNRVGFYIENSTENSLTDNETIRNFVGLQMIRSTGNLFRHSEFAGNVIQAQSTDSKDNRFEGNYWDDFAGLDANGDGYSDLSYEIDPFFLQLTKDIEPFQIFFQSPGLPFLAQMFHADTARWLKDARPLMEPPFRESAEAGFGGRWPTLLAGLLLLAASVTILYRWGYRQNHE